MTAAPFSALGGLALVALSTAAFAQGPRAAPSAVGPLPGMGAPTPTPGADPSQLIPGVAPQGRADHRRPVVDRARDQRVARPREVVGVYRPTWDLVDAWSDGRLDLHDAALLPQHMVSMTNEQREAYVIGLRDHRTKVQARIREVMAEREQWLAQARAESAVEAQEGLDDALVRMVRSQLEARGLTFTDPG